MVPEFLTGREFLKFFIDINVKKIADVKPIDEYFDFVKIESEIATGFGGLLSRYENKDADACELHRKPAILLLDEPLTSFDVVVADEMKKLLRQMKKDHIIIFSTNMMSLRWICATRSCFKRRRSGRDRKGGPRQRGV